MFYRSQLTDDGDAGHSAQSIRVRAIRSALEECTTCLGFLHDGGLAWLDLRVLAQAQPVRCHIIHIRTLRPFSGVSKRHNPSARFHAVYKIHREMNPISLSPLGEGSLVRCCSRTSSF